MNAEAQVPPGRSLIARSRQFDRAAAAHLPALLIDPLRDGEVGGSGAVVVGMERDLLVAGAAGKRAVQDLAELVDLVPGDDALLNRIEDAGLPLVSRSIRANW